MLKDIIYSRIVLEDVLGVSETLFLLSKINLGN